MNTVITPPNLDDLVMHSSELSKNEYFELAQNWSLDLPPMVPESDRKPNPVLDHITDPYAVVLYHTTFTDTVNVSSLLSVSTGMEHEVPSDTAGLNGKATSPISTRENPADFPIKTQKFQSQDSAWTNALWELRYLETTEHANESEQMPQRINIHKSVLHRSPRLRENSSASSIKHKAHVTFVVTLIKAISLFTLLYNVKDSILSMRAYHLGPNAVHHVHELNEL